MNNNNRNNNRRRGRGNRKQNGGGGNQGNRIDSRARGNAPQLLDKYKKLAQDAQHNGDRVQAEYYLQFADHYFRVIADNTTRRDEQRGPSQRRWDEDGDEGEDDGFDDSAAEQPRRRRDREDRGDEGEGGNDGSGMSSDDDFEPVGNPFVRRDRDRDVEGERPQRSERERPQRSERDRGERSDRSESGERKPRGRKPAQPAAATGEFDHSVLPPAIGRRAENDTGEEAVADEKPAPRRRRRKAGEDSAVAAE